MERASAFPTTITVIGIGVLYLGHAAVFGDYIADDAGISLAYARNLAAGYGPVLYPGGEAVEGFSNPLWTALIGIAAALRLDFADGIPLLKTLGLIFGAGALWLTTLVSRRAYPSDAPGTRWIAAAILAVWTPFVFWSGAGLENPLFVFLLLLAVLLQLREVEDPVVFPWSAAALGGVALTRPEGCAFFLAFLVHRVIAIRERRRLLRWMGIFIVICAVFLATRVMIFGDWLPNTYHAKIAEREITDVWRYVMSREDPGFRYLQLFAAGNAVVLAAAAVGFADPRYWRAHLLLVAIGGGTAAYALYVGGDFWPAFRFLTPAVPVLAIAAQHGVALLPVRTPLLRHAIAIALIALVGYRSVRTSLQLRQQHREDTLISLQGRLEQGRRMRALATALGVKDPLYLDPDIGGPSVVGLRVLDLAGLTDIHIARFHWYPVFFRDYIFKEKRPHIIRTHSKWTGESRLTGFPEFHEQYVAIDSNQDALGLHGEFVRRDLLKTQTDHGQAPLQAPSLWQAMADTRARRLHEDARERNGWVQYYADRGRHQHLLTAFRQHESDGTLPKDPRLLTDIYYGLLGAGDRTSAERVRQSAGVATPPPLTLNEGARPTLSLIAYRILQREMDWTKLQLFFEVIQTPMLNYDVELQLTRPNAAGVDPIMRGHSPPRPMSSWTKGSTMAIEMPLYVEPGTYELRARLSGRSGRPPLCTTASGCDFTLGTYTVTR